MTISVAFIAIAVLVLALAVISILTQIAALNSVSAHRKHANAPRVSSARERAEQSDYDSMYANARVLSSAYSYNVSRVHALRPTVN